MTLFFHFLHISTCLFNYLFRHVYDMTQDLFVMGESLFENFFSSARLTAKETSLYYDLLIDESRTHRFMPLPSVLATKEVQISTSDVWPLLTHKISFDNKHYTVYASLSLSLCLSLSLAIYIYYWDI